MNLDYLHEFLVLVETQNFWEASNRLFIGQSTLSRHIRLMEEELGVPLFIRTSRHVELTDYGTLMVPYAQRIMETRLSYIEEIRILKDKKAGNLILGVIPSMVPYRITDLLVHFSHQYPQERIRVMEADTLVLKEALAQQKCTLAFLRETDTFPIDENILCKIPFTIDRMVALLPPSHPLAAQQTVQLEQLKDEDFILIDQGTLLRQIAVDACQHHGFLPRVIFDYQRINSILDMVSQGVGVSLLMDHHLNDASLPEDEYHGKKFVARPISPEIQSRTYLCYRKDIPLNRTARMLVSYTEENHDLLFPNPEIKINE